MVVEAGTADDAALASLLRLPDPTAPEQVAPLRRGEVLGPAVLAYLPDEGSPQTRPVLQVDAGGSIGSADREELASWLAGQPAEDVDESAAADLEEPLVLRRGAHVVGVAGWVRWPDAVAHVGVLVDPAHRGSSAGTALGAAAVDSALAAGLAPQWRAHATNRASRSIARRLGLVEVGRQLSLEAVVAA